MKMDINYLLFLQEVRTLTGGIFDSTILSLTKLGEASIAWGLLALVYWCVDKRAGQLMALNVSFASTVNQGLKSILKIERPWIQDSRVQPVEAALGHAGGYSFPSGHTTRATAVWGALARQFWKNKEKCLSVICILACVTVAFTRNYLGVHTPQDVLAALIMGVFFIFVLDYALVWADKGKNRDLIVAVGGCTIFLLLMLRVGCLTNAGAGVGILFGWIVERRYIHFCVEGSFGRKAYRFLVGSLLLVFFNSVPNTILNLFMLGKYAGFFSNFLFTFVLMAGYPFIFSRLEKHAKAEKKIALVISIIVVVTMMLGVCLYHVKANMDRAASDVVVQETVTEVEQTEMVETSVEKKVQVIAHRGYSSEFPENTLAAFEGACEINADYIEMDVQCTKDGVLVMFHDATLARTTGASGNVIDYSYEELCELDAGSWLGAEFAGEKIPTLEETLAYLQGKDCRIYLELKDIGDVEGFAENVAATVAKYEMTNQCVYASFNYEYLMKIKEYDASSEILFNTSSDKLSIVNEYPAEYYGVHLESVSAEMVNMIHDAGSKVFVWTVDKPQEMANLIALGIDGICTNKPGLAKVIVCPEYSFLAQNFENSFTVPGMYGSEYDSMVVQGIAKTTQNIIISAYDKTGENSILYVTNLAGKLVTIVDLGFVAHVGGISYDATNDYLWLTGPEGMVYAVSCSAVLNGTYGGEILVSFDAGLVNHNDAKVASFLTWFENELFVGSWVNGANGVLNRYDLTNPVEPRLVATMSIPEKIQGVTFWKNNMEERTTMYLSQGYQTEVGALLCYEYTPENTDYTLTLGKYCLPEGIEQIQATTHGMYLLFESAAKAYRDMVNVPNDQVYLVRMPE